MERICVLVNGIAGAVVGFCTFMVGLIICMQLELYPKTIAGLYLVFIGIPIVCSSIGFYLAVRKDWWIMKRRW